jgi:hypothetical protein
MNNSWVGDVMDLNCNEWTVPKCGFYHVDGWECGTRVMGSSAIIQRLQKMKKARTWTNTEPSSRPDKPMCSGD